MDEFLRLATSNLGISEQTARSATSQLLGFLKQNAGADNASNLIDKLPGARELLAGGPATAPGRPGVLGALGGLLGGKARSSLGLLSLLQNTGMDVGHASRFVGMFLDFARQNAGAGVVDSLVAQVPALKSLQD